MRNIPIQSRPGTRVLVRTKHGGCYDNKLGVIASVKDENFEDLKTKPAGTDPGWYEVRFDIPADNGGTPVQSEIFRRTELFPPAYTRDYWGRPSTTAPH